MPLPRLPVPGDDEGTWGEILNEFLLVSHTPNGTLKAENLILGKANTTDVNAQLQTKANTADVTTQLQAKVNTSDLALVATTGSYTDLTDKPTAVDTSQFVATSDPRLTNTRIPTDDSVATNKLQDGSVTEPKLAITNTPSSGDLLGWSGSALAWQAPAADAVASVNGRTGAVEITKTDVGLSNVDNTNDVSKPLSNPTKTYVDTKVAETQNLVIGTAAPTPPSGQQVLWLDTTGGNLTLNLVTGD